jgi:hypothetical protein
VGVGAEVVVSAAGADDQAGEVVVAAVGSAFAVVGTAFGEEFSGTFEGDLVDERFVCVGGLDVAEGDGADVDRVDEHEVDGSAAPGPVAAGA